jgi:polysaccharide export outer membrane protein
MLVGSARASELRLLFFNTMKVAVFGILFFLATVATAVTLSEYELGAGDMIRIQVFGEEDLGMEVRLSDAGTISYPFLGEIQVKGLSVGRLEAAIIGGLKPDYLIDPKVSVSIIEYRQFYIHGEVKSPGGYAYLPGLTVRKAVALAGGFTERASKTKISVIHEGDEDVKKSEPIALGDKLAPGDIVTIEQSFF